ncbi:MAG: hypothetical protein UT50_C0003G0023 [Candidatus Moranbacteria bacterium GW2011_GWA2_39_41]|nr:MAG: hypothetical protein UT50_C0003G0023 [Candidatus Moranbacteria bacterium GW2011_GWA2_39_41]
MKTKNIQLSFIVLFALTIGSFAFFVSAQEQITTTKNIFLDSDQDGLSDEEEEIYGTNPHLADTDGDGYSDGTEVKSGYDPLKKSPGDKLIPDASAATFVAASEPNKSNLTEQLAQKISTAIDSASTGNQEISLVQIQSIVTETTDAQITQDELPQIASEDIKIKKQDYDKLSEEKASAQKKEDFTNYIIGLSYVLASNSPTPITSTTDIDELANSISSQLTTAITTSDASSLQGLALSGEKILQQMKDIEVPEELVDTHTKGMQLATYAIDLQTKISPNTDDPIMDITNYSKMQSLLDLMLSYSNDVAIKFGQYGLTYDDSVQNKLKDYGIVIPADLSQKLSQ